MALFKKGIYSIESLNSELVQILEEEYYKFKIYYKLKIGVPNYFDNIEYKDGSTFIIKIYMPVQVLCKRLRISTITLNKWVKSTDEIEIKTLNGRGKQIEVHSLYKYLKHQGRKG
ncbi:MAG: hypothetical protein K9I70_04065 [Chitinophagaceae bacterium]|nr:hypothetical protein [Chitinophagaceae bacterium]